MDKERYSLFLDETRNSEKKTSGIAGIAIKNDNISFMNGMLNELKVALWPDLAQEDAENIILHVTDIVRSNIRFNKEYRIFRAKSNKEQLYDGLSEILDKNDMTVFGSMINLQSLGHKYKKTFDNYIADEMCMEEILNNYACFLKYHSATGKIIFESRSNGDNDKSDRIFRKQFYKIITHGTKMYKAIELQEVIDGIEFIKKRDNNAGLQLADFVPYHFMRNFCGSSQQKENMFKTLKKKRYSGGVTKGEQLSSIFGMNFIK
ncbi:DUF3800 domain-containing protein [Lactococcus lactis]|uniref:DUF3800 domain-containing protein n=1 Tax=Lactococcus lactis TaxID=1358 RepID=UPI001911D7D1|nr:DUF3800 domain-containing protein [Lactococcus lactis]MBK5077101.1 DUF3800 domain-containing protein [Lactococcus lactis]